MVIKGFFLIFAVVLAEIRKTVIALNSRRFAKKKP